MIKQLLLGYSRKKKLTGVGWGGEGVEDIAAFLNPPEFLDFLLYPWKFQTI